MKILLVFTILVLVVTTYAAVSHTTTKIWPKPANFTFTPEGTNLTISPCDIKFIIEAPSTIVVSQIISLYQIQVFSCSKTTQGKVSLNVVVKNTDVMLASNTAQQKYSLTIRQNNKWELSADFYVGFLRAFQTFSQLFEPTQNGYVVYGIPINIDDAPQFLWRGLMIDTSRHFLPVSTIKKAIDSMLYTKLNVLHWHIVDEDAFPLYVPTVPQLSQSGSVGGVYSQNDVKSIISYAKTRGIRVIPQIDTPAHTQSWGRSQKYKNITLNCNGIYQGQLDPTLNTTWDVLSKVLTYVNNSFTDNYVHFGGDQVVYNCWGNRQSIIDYMKANNISDYKHLSIDFREREKKLWRQISPKKKVIYWANEDIDLPMQDEDVIQWWGVSSNVGKMAGRKNQVILSNYDLTYLDIGFGNFYGNNYGVYQNWRKMYNFNPRITNVNVIGGQSCMWNELGNKYTFEQKVIQRSAVIAQRLWNDKVVIGSELNNIARRLYAHTQRLRSRGYKVWPVTVGLCEKDMDVCF